MKSHFTYCQLIVPGRSGFDFGNTIQYSFIDSGPVFCLLLGVSSVYAQLITGHVTEVTCPVILSKRQRTGPDLLVTVPLDPSNENRYILQMTSQHRFRQWPLCMAIWITVRCTISLNIKMICEILNELGWRRPLQWRHNGCDSASSHQPRDCFTQPFIQTQIKENIKAPRHWPFFWGIRRGPVNSPHKWPVTRKMFPFNYVIMLWNSSKGRSDSCGHCRQYSAAGWRIKVERCCQWVARMRRLVIKINTTNHKVCIQSKLCV